jgi:hypothetical protein
MRKLLLAAIALFFAVVFPVSGHAFCGFYVSDSGNKLFNNATQVALMREGTRTVLSMQNNYEGPPERFALVIPVPVVLQKENVKTLPRDLFTKLEQLDAPRLVEYWEQDPCAQGGGIGTGQGFGSGHGRLGGAHSRSAGSDLGVTVEAQFTVGEYEIVILSAEDSGGLDTWLRREKYNIPAGAEPYLRPYVAKGSKFFVAKVDPAKVTFDEHHQAQLSPLRFHYDSEQFTLPVRLGLLNAKDTQDLIVHVLAKGQRYEAANYENVAIPTNLDVGEDAKKDFAGVYNALFDDTVREHPKSVVTEYSWDAATCDPCPGPALSGQDLATLGADALPQTQPAQPAPRRMWRSGGGFVLTRLHARYTKEALGDDLVFRAAPPIVGGREMRAFGTTLEQTPSPSSFNNFQARYAIRHPWTGEIKCEHPVRDVWGGPPQGQSNEKPSAATNLAFSDRSSNKLSTFVSYKSPPITSTQPPPTPSASATPSPTPPAKSGCTCALAGIPVPIPIPHSTFSALLLAAWILRRRRP